MRAYAMTYPQLMNQAVSAGLAEPDLARLRDGHELAVGLTLHDLSQDGARLFIERYAFHGGTLILAKRLALRRLSYEQGRWVRRAIVDGSTAVPPAA